MRLRIWRRRVFIAAVGTLAFLLLVASVVSSLRWFDRPFPGFFLYGNLTVTPDFQPHWSGSREGLRFLDRVVAVEGRPITDSQEIYDLVRSRPAPSSFRYTIERGEKRFSIAIPSMKFSFHDWLLSYGTYLLTGLGFLIIGAAPFFLSSTSPAASPLFFMACTVFLWFATTFDFVTAAVLPKEIRVFAFTFTPSAGLHLGLLLTQGGKKRRGHWAYLCLLYGTSTLLGLFYSLSFFGPPEVWRFSLKAGYVYSCLAATLFLVLLLSALRRPHSDLERCRLRVVLVGSVLGFLLPTLGTVLSSSFHWQIPYNFLSVFTVFFSLSVAYALVKYSLFDLDSALKLGLTRVALTGVLLLIYGLVVSLLGFSVGIYDKGPLVPLLFSIFVVLIFNPLLRWVEGMVDQYLYHGDYDPAQLQEEAGRMLCALVRPQALAEQYLHLLRTGMGVESTHLFFQPGDQEDYAVVVHSPGSYGSGKALSVGRDSPVLRLLAERKRGVSRSEVETDPFYQRGSQDPLRFFHRLDSEIIIPLIFEERLVGFIAFGKKRSGKGYSGSDLNLLSNLAGPLVLSLKNGMLFEESERAKESYQCLYDQSQLMNQKLVEVDRLKRQFVANISHELRTPISALLGYAEVLSDREVTGETKAILERMIASGEDLSQLLDGLLEFSRMEAGALALARHGVPMREFLQSLETVVRRLIKDYPIEFKWEVEPDLEVVETDPKKLQQILLHLLTNAVKFTERGEIAVRARIAFEGGKGAIRISVSDTGIGISARDQGIIFEEFRQIDGSSTRKYGGTGLGLALCRRLAQSLGGEIAVQSEVGWGSTFSLILPLSGRAERITPV